MTEEIQLARLEQLLEENLELAEENNKLLREMRRWSRLGVFVKVILWAAVIILPFLLLKPVIEQLFPAATGISDPAFQEVLDMYLNP